MVKTSIVNYAISLFDYFMGTPIEVILNTGSRHANNVSKSALAMSNQFPTDKDNNITFLTCAKYQSRPHLLHNGSKDHFVNLWSPVYIIENNNIKLQKTIPSSFSVKHFGKISVDKIYCQA